jgi:hypothetical protein
MVIVNYGDSKSMFIIFKLLLPLPVCRRPHCILTLGVKAIFYVQFCALIAIYATCMRIAFGLFLHNGAGKSMWFIFNRSCHYRHCLSPMLVF